ncbi:hypothetical protein AB9P05_04880 [Roseivirga sp. BDSF3-8]|uniref:hypothetical protein n=1 Tax=Roseivirga sp. BDSF3-8 TaxID=3241598 RepID=UPI0035326B0D
MWRIISCWLVLAMLAGCQQDEVINPAKSEKDKGPIALYQQDYFKPVEDITNEPHLLNALRELRPETLTSENLLLTKYGPIASDKIRKGQMTGSDKITYYLYIDNLRRNLTWTDLVLKIAPGKPVTGYTRHYQPTQNWLYDTKNLRGNTFSGTVTTQRLHGKVQHNMVYERGIPKRVYAVTPNSQ